MRILLTRPEANNAALIKALENSGAEVVCSPLTKIDYLKAPPKFDTEKLQALIFTSANGVRAFEHHYGSDLTLKETKVFAVGRTTGNAALKIGFKDIHFASGTQENLTETIIKHASPALGTLIHMAGRHLTGDLKKELQQHCFSAKRLTLYEATENNTLSAKALTGKFDVMAFYSMRAAEIFQTLSHKKTFPLKLSHCKAICLSPAISNMLHRERWSEILTAAEPNEQALWDLINIRL
jgi:uroporphyrinogen-III synthase